MGLADDGPAKYVGLDPFGGRKIRTKETLGGQREATGGDQSLLHEPKLVKHLNKFKDHKPDEQLMFADNCQKINIKVLAPRALICCNYPPTRGCRR
jgi:hypothetical protein